MRHRSIFANLLCPVALCAALIAADSPAQEVVPKARFMVSVDAARFRNDDSTGYVEIYYGFYPALVCFDKRGNQYEGGLQVATRIRDAHTKAYVLLKNSIVPVVLSDSARISMSSMMLSRAGYVLPFGDYVLETVVIDSLRKTRRDSIFIPFKLSLLGPAVVTSDLELCSNVRSSESRSELFFKNSLEVVPNPSLVFGASSYPMMFNYAELYNLDPKQTYSIKSQVIAQNGKVVKESTKQRRYGVKNAVEAGTTNVASIESGRYRFRLTIGDTVGSVLTQVEKVFYLNNPHIQVSAPAASSVKAAEFAGMTADELGAEFQRAGYLATEQEKSTFSQISSEDGRREFLAKFWSEVETGRFGKAGILRSVYLQRVGAANQRFRSLGREGWKTDRGRAIILYGEPDEIERFPSSQESKPYEIWHYYSIENGVEFDFVDRSGFGDYTLVNSTKRGELQDTDWQRYLQ